MINVHSAATSGQLAPSFKLSDEDNGPTAGRFDQLLASELAVEGEALNARDNATVAEMASGRAQVPANPNGVQPGSDTPKLGAASAPLLVTERAAPPASANVSAVDDAVAALSGHGDTIVATSAEHARPAAAPVAGSNGTMAPRTTPVAATISLGGGPILGASVTDGLTRVADADPAAPQNGSGAMVSSSNTSPEDQGTMVADLDGSTGEEGDAGGAAGASLATLIPLVAAMHIGKAIGQVLAETTVTTGKLASTSLATKAPAGARKLIEAADASEKASGQAKRAELADRTPPFEMAADMPAGAGPHRAGSLSALTAVPLGLATAPVAATPLSAAVAQSGPAAADTAALRHVERLYAPHDGAAQSGSAGVFARLGTIGQDTGVALARGVADGRDHVAIRLDPPDLGRIDVQLSFGQDGGLRAVVASDNRAALDLLRRDLDQLQRALADAGVRADAQSFHFSERQPGGSQRWDAPVARDQRHAALTDPAAERPSAAPIPRRLRSSGLIDVFA
ncbi:flagellar hook-length control protein FliK [Sphingomonas phyllosphaerae]|uniref:flagellar hook-length control protein FliK n=1 Tax=Sphingomonas phyllosphaerae TaxID=257003 RepID=UPI0024136360|nr:flagellar hook-length control protein FliK [Sphingomonas phyllosphaerae]